jgi:transglutaminase-like putative cysteine protease
MKKYILILLLAASAISLESCHRGKHFITGSSFRDRVYEQFQRRKELAKNRSEQLFSVFDKKDLTLGEKEAMWFLYAYMPLSDLADYDGNFFLSNVRSSVSARDTFSWGEKIPDEIFRHFVLPIRVNNENLDSSRIVFFAELKNRILKLSMKDAVLEVNHWCHEKVTYRASDERTSTPLATVKNALGRCGEESTFAVAALRSVCIPARQCYTPRWAHCDDNHAWVEVWVDGKWHYIGACEPEAVLDRAWFTGPAKRAMLVNTNVFGDYQGTEDVLLRDELFTRINLLPNYTETKRVFIKVTGTDSKPVDSAVVEFQLYNYSEFYPLTKCITGKNGICSFLTGFGDLVIWAAKGNDFGYHKITVKNTDTLVLMLDKQPGFVAEDEMDLVPPPEQSTDSKLDENLKKKNDDRLTFEDKLRTDYERTFIDSSKTWRLAKNLKLDPDTLWYFLKKSRGNWRELIDFISSVPEDRKGLIFPLLANISEKDLHDVTTEVLMDNIGNSISYTAAGQDRSVFHSYILSPRIDVENLRPFKSYFQKVFDKSFINRSRKDPGNIILWINGNIVLNEKENYSKAPLTPIGSYELKVADRRSRNILFVALCRSFGIPARIDPATRIPQYLHGTAWIDVYLEKPYEKIAAKCRLTLDYLQTNKRRPEYYTNFTLQKLENGFYRTLDYENEMASCTYPHSVDLEPGSYLVMTGVRTGTGTVCSKLSFLSLKAGESRMLELQFRDVPMQPPVLGHVNDLRKFVQSLGGTSEIPVNKGIVIAWVKPDNEPSRHFIADLILKKQVFESWKGAILLLFANDDEKKVFIQKNRNSLPSGTKFMTASPGSLDMLGKVSNTETGTNLPVVTFFDTKGNLSFLSAGYRIGTCAEIISLLK